jgi:putative oxygen-independent coproporphyrinogen III oxidase
VITPISHLYVHVPFCPSICPYCDFHILERRAGSVEAFLLELERDAAELERAYGHESARGGLQTVYLGGGTPSFLRDAEISKLVQIIRAHFGWASQEATLEVNPGTVTKSRAQLWRDLGFSRASLGVQSTQDHVLKFLGRTHDSRQAFSALEILLETGFRVSADAITAVPDQDVERDLRALASLGLEHMSCYTLTIEEDTPFARQGVSVREEDEERSLELAENILLEYGLQRYEVSNHAKPGFESRHNIAYWQNRYWYGLGPGAAGHYPIVGDSGSDALKNVVSRRRTNPHFQTWLEGNRGEIEDVTREGFITDGLFSGLRMKRGVDLRDLSTRAGLDAFTHFKTQFESLQSRGLLEFDGEIVRATANGIWVLNQVVSEFL